MNTPVTAYTRELKQRRSAPLATPTDLSAKARLAISPALNAALADVYALYLKTRNFHWRMSGPHFRDWHLMLDEQATQLLAGSPGNTHQAVPVACPIHAFSRTPSCSTASAA